MGQKLSLFEHIRQKTSNPIETAAHARALVPHVLTLCQQDALAPTQADDPLIDATTDLLDAMQRVIDADAATVLRSEVLPALQQLYDRIEPQARDASSPWASHILFFLKIFALYGGDESLRRIREAVRTRLDPEGFVWSAVFGELAEASDDAQHILDALADPPPEGFVGVALLDLANTRWRAAPDLAVHRPHAFDTPAGRARLAEHLASRDPDRFSYAHSATVALAGLAASEERNQLLAMADAHPDLYVRMEAAWVRGRERDEAAIARLSAWSADPRTGRRAAEYLRELGRLDAIPDVVNSLDYFALAEMSAWLAHPLELGRPPDEVALVDHRRMYWPPTNDERDMWLVRYRYGTTPEDLDEGVGCVGSVTFALFGEATTDLDADDLYGLYCCWELEQAGDARAPRHRSALAGRKLLGIKKKK